MRALLSFPLGILVALSLFYLMYFMISSGSGDLRKAENVTVVNFIRLQKEEIIETRKRAIPKKPPPPKEPPPPPKMKLSKAPAPNAPDLKMEMPDITTPGMKGGPFLGAMSGGVVVPLNSDGDIVALVRIAPQYPRKAAMDKKEGWVKVAFTITKTGTVKDAKVIDSKPRRLFNRAALKAILKWKFKPRVVDGKVMERQAEQVIEFKLSK